jgi:transcriptional regulator with GAF, ATPase, and Fis domain
VFQNPQKLALSALAASAVLYGLLVLWYVPTQPCIPLGCLLTNSDDSDLPGLEIRDVRLLGPCKGAVPEVGDHVIEAAGRPIRSFADWVRVHRALRGWRIDSAARISSGKDPSEESLLSDLAVVESTDRTRLVRVWFLRPGNDVPSESWIELIPESTSNISVTLSWFVLQLCVLILGGVAYWNRPFDQPLRAFFALSAVTLMAFVGGSHWWIIAANPMLISVFAISGVLLPAVLLHFFLIYPYPMPAYERSRPYSGWAIYFVPGILALWVTGMIVLLTVLTANLGPGPYAATFERMTGKAARAIMPLLRQGIYTVFWTGVLYFIVSLMAIRRSLRAARNPLEYHQVQWILWAALVASVLIGYTMYLALEDQVNFALGRARLPMFGASLAFMLAYAIGVARYKLLLIDQVVTRGVWYYGASVVLALAFAALIAVGAVNALHQEFTPFGRQTVPLVLVLMTSVLVLSWGRDALQRNLDRRFFSEKYQLDKALNRMNHVITSVLEPEAVSESLLHSCLEVLHIDEAAIYMRKSNRLEFRMSTAVGRGGFPLQVTMEPEAFDAVTENTVLQRVPHTSSPAQRLLRQLHAEVVHNLEMQGHLGGLLVLGAKPNKLLFSAEDLAFVGAMARISGIALHCAMVQQDVTRLNQDLQQKMDKIEDQSRQLSALRHELAGLSKLPAAIPAEEDFRRAGIKGHSSAMLAVLETVRKVAGSASSVLIRGESGTGKELLARAIHENSPRASGPLVSVHCASLSPTLLESELFGHVKGAFTDARQDKIGRFQLADGGTLFLDEIGDISLDVQVKLLRVLQERTFEPVGSTTPVAVDVRIVAATHRNLEQLIAEGRFREDLFYRLNVISLQLPPLRERRDDLFELALHFLHRASEKSGKNILKIDDDALKCLENHSWPGNIRELQNAMERAAVLAETDAIRVVDLPAEVRQAQQLIPGLATRHGAVQNPNVAEASGRHTQIVLRRKTVSRQEDEKGMIEQALQECQGNRAEAARLLGMPRSTFFSKMKKHGLN